MKKILTVACLLFVLLITLTGCGNLKVSKTGNSELPSFVPEFIYGEQVGETKSRSDNTRWSMNFINASNNSDVYYEIEKYAADLENAGWTDVKVFLNTCNAKHGDYSISVTTEYEGDAQITVRKEK